MHISYNKLWKLLIDQQMSKSELRKKAKLATGTMTKLVKDNDVSLDVIKRICCICKCNIGDIMDILPDENEFQ